MKEKNKKIAKFFIALAIIIMIFTIFDITGNKQSYATDISISSIFQKGNDFISSGQSQVEQNSGAGITEDELAAKFIPVGKVLVAVATATLFIVTAIMGIKWITATPEQQAQLKKQMIGLVVSIIVIYGAVGIWTIVRNIMTNLTR